MKFFLILVVLIFSQSNIAFAGKVLKTKNSKMLVKLTRAEASQVVTGDKVNIFDEKDEAIVGKVVRIKANNTAVITSEDFIEFKVNDFIDVELVEDEDDDDLEDELEDELD